MEGEEEDEEPAIPSPSLPSTPTTLSVITPEFGETPSFKESAEEAEEAANFLKALTPEHQAALDDAANSTASTPDVGNSIAEQMARQLNEDKKNRESVSG